MTEGLTKLKQLEANKPKVVQQLAPVAPAAKKAVIARKEPGFWEWLGDLFSF